MASVFGQLLAINSGLNVANELAVFVYFFAHVSPFGLLLSLV
jgi:hypothetical protein